MALSNQDLSCQILLGNKGYYVDIGAGNGRGEPCASNTAWLEEIGWTGLLLDINQSYMNEAKTLRPKSLSHACDILKTNIKTLFQIYKVPKVIDYLSIDIDPYSVSVLELFPFDEYEFKFLTIEHDFYNPWGPRQKEHLKRFMADKPFKLIYEDAGLVFHTVNYLEDWYINPKFKDDFLVKDVESLYYYRINPNEMVLDLISKKK